MKDRPLANLGEEELDLVERLVLASGSLKELAGVYGVSYPTIRGRLDRVIEHLRSALAARPVDPMAELLADLVEKGEVTPRWTPMAMAPTLAKSSDRAVVFVGGDRLERAVEAGKIQRITDTGPVPVRPDEIRVRFNNWDRVRAERLPLLALNAALLGMGVVLLGIGTRRAVAPA